MAKCIFCQTYSDVGNICANCEEELEERLK